MNVLLECLKCRFNRQHSNLIPSHLLFRNDGTSGPTTAMLSTVPQMLYMGIKLNDVVYFIHSLRINYIVYNTGFYGMKYIVYSKCPYTMNYVL